MKSNPLRILQVFTVMNRGGAESMIMNYYRHIDRTKVQFDFLVHRKERGAFDNEIEALGGRMHRLDPISFHNPYAYQKILDAFLTTNNYTVIHSHLNAMSKFILKVAKENQVPIRIAHSHIALPKLSIKSILQKKMTFPYIFKIVYKNIAKKNITKYATHFFACEQKAADWLFGNHKETQIINNAIDANSFSYDKTKSISIKSNLNIEGQYIVGHVGRFNTQKNHNFLIDIFYEFQKSEPNTVLLLIGDGVLKQKIINKVNNLLISDKVKFLGIRSDISDLLQAIDIFLFPSLYEGLPVTLVEAQAGGLKCFVSDVIDNNIDFTNLVRYISLNKSSKEWADIILREKEYTRKNLLKIAIDNNYDITNNALELQNFYINSAKDA